MKSLLDRFNFRAPKSVLFYLLGFYVLLQFVWWAYMLVDLNAEIYELKLQLLQASQIAGPEQVILKGDLHQKLSLRIWMVLGEGAVFVTILLLGFRSVRKSIEKELKLAEQQKNFLLSVTHELRSPLASVKLQLQTLQTRKLDEEKVNQLQGRALRDVHRLEKLVENLLLVNKAESGKLPLQKVETELHEFIDRILTDHYSQEIESSRLVFDRSESAKASIDVMAFDSVLMNLIDNALKYGNGSQVELSIVSNPDKESTEIKVSDLGPGIIDTEKSKVFDRFYRIGNEEVRKTKGTGIGLYLVKLLVEQHGGSIEVTNNSPQGSVFSVTIPTVSK